MSDKTVIVINGKGGSGKDTICQIIGKHYRTHVASAIVPIKDVASQLGWNGEKDLKSRKFLSDLKMAAIEYNDYPTRYLKKVYEKFLDSDCNVLFVHIREAEEINKFKSTVDCTTLLIRSQRTEVAYGNASDDDVENYDYDFIYENNKSLDDVEADFLEFFNTKIKKE